MTDLATWLLQQIAADEAEYTLTDEDRRDMEAVEGDDWTPVCDFMVAECAAKRRIVLMAAGSADFYDALSPIRPNEKPYHSPSVDILIRVCQLLALPYAGRAGYLPEWAPDA